MHLQVVLLHKKVPDGGDIGEACHFGHESS